MPKKCGQLTMTVGELKVLIAKYLNDHEGVNLDKDQIKFTGENNYNQKIAVKIELPEEKLQVKPGKFEGVADKAEDDVPAKKPFRQYQGEEDEDEDEEDDDI